MTKKLSILVEVEDNVEPFLVDSLTLVPHTLCLSLTLFVLNPFPMNSTRMMSMEATNTPSASSIMQQSRRRAAGLTGRARSCALRMFVVREFET